MHILAKAHPEPTYEGVQGEISKDNFWVWDFGEWVYNFNY